MARMDPYRQYLSLLISSWKIALANRPALENLANRPFTQRGCRLTPNMAIGMGRVFQGFTIWMEKPTLQARPLA